MPKMSKKKIIAITGSMGSGKSMVSTMIQKRYPVLDADQVNRDLIKMGNAGYRALSKKLTLPLDSHQEINKSEFSKKIFSDPIYRDQVEAILHPLIMKAIQDWIKNQKNTLVFIEIPLLFEAGMEDHFEEIWCVVCDEEVALERLKAGRNISREEAKARLACQYSPVIKIQKSDVVLYNNGTIEQLQEQVDLYLERSAM